MQNKNSNPRPLNKERLINVLMKSGKGRRVTQSNAEDLLSRGEATRYISSTIYKALSAGIEVKDFSNRDTDGALKARIKAASSKEKASQEVKTEAVTEEEVKPKKGERLRRKRRRSNS